MNEITKFESTGTKKYLKFVKKMIRRGEREGRSLL